MKIIKEGIVFSNDIFTILKGNNALNYSYERNGLKIPSEKDIEKLRVDFKKDVNRIFNNKVEIISEEEMISYLNESISDIKKEVIVSLDRVFLNDDIDNENDIYFLDCTRVSGSENLISRNRDDRVDNIDNQIKDISDKLKERGINEIFLFDDVVYSGNVLRTIIEKFQQNGIKVQGIRACISTKCSYNYFNNTLEQGLRCGCLLGEKVIDQICERDFYFGIVQSGISTFDNTGKVCKTPYFKPFGNPNERASIPKEYEKFFSNGCLLRSMYLWKKIEENTGRKIYIRELPEIIINTKENDTIIDVLRKGLRYNEKDTNRDNGFCR